ncbi:MAG: HAD family hydrolase [Kofleriaceae bacterium]|nr:HAD family hydrolase [Candidatus Methylomirabilis lanthanidiphila]
MAGANSRAQRGILLDFDHTLFDTDRFFWVDLKSAFAQFSISDDAWEKSYETIWPSGYSLRKHLEALFRLGAIASVSVASAMHATLERTFSDLRSYLFPDVVEFLNTARRRGFELILLSFGDPTWQSYKVRTSGLTPYFTQIVYTSDEKGKAGMLNTIASAYAELCAVDNNPADLDAMKASIPRLQTYLICRVEPSAIEGNRFREAARYLTVPSRLPHRHCRSLHEVSLPWRN